MDSFVFQVDWATVAAVIGLLGSLVAVFVYGGRHARPPLPATLVYLLILEYVVAYRN
jgi:hypothetical protein